MTKDEELKSIRLYTAFGALSIASRGAYDRGELREAAKLYARADVAETKAAEYTDSLLEVPRAEVEAAFWSAMGRPIL